MLDTNVLIEAFKQSTGFIGQINRPARRTSLVVLWEFMHLGKGQRLREEEWVGRIKFLDDLGILPVFISPRAEPSFRLQVNRIDSGELADSLLAADCVARGWPLVTRNLRDFEEVDQLLLVDPHG